MGAFSPDAGCTLTTSLVSYWNLDEASGTRVDSFDANDLTDNNTVTQATGKVGNAAQFTRANSEYLSHADNASLSTGDIDFTIACWVYLDSKPGDMGIVIQSTATSRGYALKWENGNALYEFFVGNGSSGIIGDIEATTFGTPATGVWHFVVAWHDSVNNTVNIQVDNGTVDSTSTSGAAGDSTADFNIGANASGTVQFFDGRIDEVGFWKKVLSSQERTDLYNGGSGNTYNPAGTCTVPFNSRMFALFD
jgi:hypothetical protein